VKILVTGSRDFTDYDLLKTQLDYTLSYETVILIHGGQRGADKLASRWCKENPRVYEIELPAKWALLGKPAGMARNRVMAELKPDQVKAFYKTGAANVGTAGMVGLARVSGVRTIDQWWQE